MIDLSTLRAIRLSPQPVAQKIMARVVLAPNYSFLPGIDLKIEDFNGLNLKNLPQDSVIFAMNHTDMYNYWPFQYELYRQTGRLTATWVKGKYYKHPWVAKFLELMNNFPAVSKGYILTVDFEATTGHKPSDAQYRLLRAALDEERSLSTDEEDQLPAELLGRRREIMGHRFEPAQKDYISTLVELHHAMMGAFSNINQQAVDDGIDLLIFPQGTRSKRLSRGHIGLSQIALRFKKTVVPVGCSGSDNVYIGNNPFAKKGRITYRVGSPIHYHEVPQCHVNEEFAPFTRSAEEKYRSKFQAHADIVMSKINELVDDDYKFSDVLHSDGVSGSNRFV